MPSILRRLTILAVLAVLLISLTQTLQAASLDSAKHPQPGNAESVLLDAANRDRAAHGLRPLQWDTSLASAARQHAQRMAQRNSLSHQFPGEPPMQDRARQAGARFSLIAENVAEGPTVIGLHTQWMNSPPHRANLLDPELNSVGIAVVQNGRTLFAVQDFSTAVLSLSHSDQEREVQSQLAASGLHPVNVTSDARRACNRKHGFTEAKPLLVLRYEVSDLSRLPDDVLEKLQSGKYHSASVGACDPREGSDFAGFRIAILLF